MRREGRAGGNDRREGGGRVERAEAVGYSEGEMWRTGNGPVVNQGYGRVAKSGGSRERRVEIEGVNHRRPWICVAAHGGLEKGKTKK